jgi:hypothetical protein
MELLDLLFIREELPWGLFNVFAGLVDCIPWTYHSYKMVYWIWEPQGHLAGWLKDLSQCKLLQHR